MRCEIIAIGTELLLGQIVDTNSSWMGEQLAAAGIDSHFQTKVGDNLGRMVECLRIALGRSDAVIVCGGLGPTQDDITREALAEVMGVRLVRQPEIGERIRRMFEARGRVMSENNLRQADVPEGASIIGQMPGTAPGLVCPLGGQVMYAVPGVPFEMRAMMEGTIIPDLQRRAGVSAVIRSRVMRTWGQSESGLAEILAGRIEALDAVGNPTLAFQASGIEGIKVRITAKAGDESAARAILDEEEKRLRALLGRIVFGVDDENMEAAVVTLMRRRGRSFAIAEEVTGGLMASRLNEVEGAGDVFAGSVVVGNDASARALLGGAVARDEAGALALARAVRERAGSAVGLAVVDSGHVDASSGRPTGEVYLGLALAGDEHAETVLLPGDRRRIRQYAVISALNLLRLRMDDRAA